MLKHIDLIESALGAFSALVCTDYDVLMVTYDA
jgi:hypothetical protein